MSSACTLHYSTSSISRYKDALFTLSIFPPFFFKEIQIIIKRRIARPEAGYYVDLVRRLIIVLYENCTCLNGPKKKEKIAPNMLLFYANRSASHEYENIITDCSIYTFSQIAFVFCWLATVEAQKAKRYIPISRLYVCTQHSLKQFDESMRCWQNLFPVHPPYTGCYVVVVSQN